MQDDKNSAKGDEFEDIDLDDLEADDDFDDDSWDDFDDEELEPDAASDLEESEHIEPAESGAEKKSFLQKNFTLIVIAIAVIGGGGFVFLQFSKTPATPQPGTPAETQMDAIVADSDDAFPPMPAPIESAGDNQIALNPDEIESLDLAAQESPEEGDVLTPLPDFSAGSDEDSLADLDLSDEDFGLTPDESMQDQLVGDETDELLDLEQISPDMPGEADILLEAPAEDISAATEDIPVLDMEETPDAPVQADNGASDAVVTELKSTLSRNEEALQEAGQREEALFADLKAAKSEIKTLNEVIGDLQSEINALKAAASQKPGKSIAPSAQKKSTAPSTPKEASIASTSMKNDANIEWVMRSARPGEATISQKGRGDFRRVEVGDRVTGLGRIQSIAVENGLWVVRGSEGSVSQ